jgi:hypothetical protein
MVLAAQRARELQMANELAGSLIQTVVIGCVLVCCVLWLTERFDERRGVAGQQREHEARQARARARMGDE